MSFYNMLFGTNEKTDIILGMLGIPGTSFFDRFRDVDLIEKGTKIRVLTRTGGNNRDYHEENWNIIKKHKFYVCDYDDEFDETYAYIEFQTPSNHLENAKKIFKQEPMKVGDKFEKEIAKMDDPNSEASKKAEQIADRIMNAIENDENIIMF